MAIAARQSATSAFDAIREKVEAGERLDMDDGLTLMESDDILALGELADTARRAARRHRRGLLRPEPLLEPDERLPREVQVLRVRPDREAGGRVHVHARASSSPTRSSSTRRPASRRSTWSAARARTSASTTTWTSSRSLQRGAARRPPEALHGERDPPHDDALGALARAGAARAAGGRARVAARRRRRDLRRPRAPADRARQGASGHLDRDAPHRARPRHPDALHHALRPRRDLRGADRPPAPAARPPGRDRRLPRVHPARVPPGEHRLRAARLEAVGRHRRPEGDRRVAAHARQHPEREGLLDHDGHAHGGRGPALRGERRPGHGHARDDLPRGRARTPRRSRRSRSSSATSATRAGSPCSATRSTTSCGGGSGGTISTHIRHAPAQTRACFRLRLAEGGRDRESRSYTGARVQEEAR